MKSYGCSGSKAEQGDFCVCVAFLLAYYTRLQLGCPVDVRYIRIGSRKDKNGHADYL